MKYSYKLVYKKKENLIHEKERKEGLGISYNTEKFKFINNFYFNFNIYNYFKNKYSEYNYILEILESLNYNNISMFTILQDKKTNKMILFVNNHLIFNKNKYDCKFYQLLIIFDIIKLLKNDYNINTVIMGGDFNLIPNSMLYSFITNRSHLDLNIKPYEYSNQYTMFSHSNIKSPLLYQLIDTNIYFKNTNKPDEKYDKVNPEFYKILNGVKFIHNIKYSYNKNLEKETIEIIPDFIDNILDINFSLENINCDTTFIKYIDYYNKLSDLYSFKSSYPQLLKKLNINDIIKHTDYKYILDNNNLLMNDITFEPLVTHYTKDFKSTCDYLMYFLSGTQEI